MIDSPTENRWKVDIGEITKDESAVCWDLIVLPSPLPPDLFETRDDHIVFIVAQK